MLQRSAILLVIIGGLLVSGCSHVSLQPDAASVLAISADDAAACERLGKTRVEVLAKVLFFPRGKDTVASELTTMARNSALDMSGNAVVPESEVEGGKQTFGVYRCPTS